MLVYDLHSIGRMLYEMRKQKGLTQSEVAEKAEISDRAYADIERGTVNMRIETVLRICAALEITPDEILIKKDEEGLVAEKEALLSRLDKCSQKEAETALKLLEVYLNSLNK